MTARLVAYENRAGGFIFVKVPGEYGRYVRTNYSVALVDCPACKSLAGVPCMGQYSRYTGSTHVDRLHAAKEFLRSHGLNVNSAARNSDEHPVVRDDILHEEDAGLKEPSVIDLRAFFK